MLPKKCYKIILSPTHHTSAVSKLPKSGTLQVRVTAVDFRTLPKGWVGQFFGCFSHLCKQILSNIKSNQIN